jgi:hypothetical protein
MMPTENHPRDWSRRKKQLVGAFIGGYGGIGAGALAGMALTRIPPIARSKLLSTRVLQLSPVLGGLGGAYAMRNALVRYPSNRAKRRESTDIAWQNLMEGVRELYAVKAKWLKKGKELSQSAAETLAGRPVKALSGQFSGPRRYARPVGNSYGLRASAYRRPGSLMEVSGEWVGNKLAQASAKLVARASEQYRAGAYPASPNLVRGAERVYNITRRKVRKDATAAGGGYTAAKNAYLRIRAGAAEQAPKIHHALRQLDVDAATARLGKMRR